MDTTATSIRELRLTRIIGAPRKLVFKAWTDPIHLKQWWGPRGFTNPLCELDLRPGGRIRICMDSPHFPNHWMTGVFREIIEPEKLVFSSYAFEDASGNSKLEALNTVTFEEFNGVTRLHLHAVVIKATPDLLFALDGMEQGWSESLYKLADTIDRIR